MEKNLNKDVSSLLSTFEKIDKVVQNMTANMNKFSKTVSDSRMSTSGIVAPNGGQMGNGSSGGNFLSSSLQGTTAAVGSILAKNRSMNMWGGIAKGVFSGLAGFGGAAMAAMPSVAETQARSMGFYQAATYSGVGRNTIARATFSAMAGGLTAAGNDAVVGATLANQGILYGAGGINRGQFTNLARSTANAAKYLGMSNETAVGALSGLSSGSTSSNLMKKFGIWTTNPITGKTNTPTETFRQLNDRLLNGKKLSRAELGYSYHGGNLGENLRTAFGGDQAQMDLMFNYMLSRASDSKTGEMDLSSNAAMKSVLNSNPAGVNPMQSQMTMNTANTKTMQAASDAYIKGMQDAAKAVEAFNGAIQKFLGTGLGQMVARGTALAEGVTGNLPVAEVGGAIMSGLGGVKDIFGAIAQNRMLKNTWEQTSGEVAGGKGTTVVSGGAGGKAGRGPKGATWNKKAGRWVDNKSGKFVKGAPPSPKAGGNIASKLGKVAGKIGNGMLGAAGGDLIQGVAGGLGADKNTSYWAGLAGAFGTGELIGGAETFGVAGLISAGMYAVGNWDQTMKSFGALFGGGGAEGTIATSRTTVTTGAIKLIHPVGHAKISCKYGGKGGVHTVPHLAIDWAVGQGTPVQAGADGVVKTAGGSATNTMGTSNKSYGLHVIIDHGSGWTTVYGHLSSIGVRQGQEVKQGQTIGLSGNTGYSTGPHLHFELRKDGKSVDPSTALGGNYAAVNGDYSAVDSQGTASNQPGGAMSGPAELIGYAGAGIAKAGGVSLPGSYRGAQSSTSVGTATGSSSALGHGATTTSTGGSIGNGTGGGPDGTPGRAKKSGGNANSVTINLTIANASDAEAKRFAKQVKQILEEDKLMENMGAL